MSDTQIIGVIGDPGFLIARFEPIAPKKSAVHSYALQPGVGVDIAPGSLTQYRITAVSGRTVQRYNAICYDDTSLCSQQVSGSK